MRNSRWWLASSVFALMLVAVAAPRVARAGCWSCEYDPAIGAYDCVGLGENNDGWQYCTPEWESDDVWCKFSGTFGACINPHCVGCRRTPALPVEPAPEVVTSEIILFSLGDNAPSLDLTTLPVHGPVGLDASEAAAALKARTGLTPTVVGYEVRSSRRFTTVRYKATDKSELMLLAHVSPGGFVVRTFESTDGHALQPRARASVRTGQAAVVPVQINGKSCVALIYTHAPAHGTAGADMALSTQHELFTDAVLRYPSRSLMGLEVDSPKASAIGLEPWALQALADNALASALRN